MRKYPNKVYDLQHLMVQKLDVMVQDPEDLMYRPVAVFFLVILLQLDRY